MSRARVADSISGANFPAEASAGAVAAGGVAVSLAEGAGVRLHATQAQMAIASRVGRETCLARLRMAVTGSGGSAIMDPPA